MKKVMYEFEVSYRNMLIHCKGLKPFSKKKTDYVNLLLLIILVILTKTTLIIRKDVHLIYLLVWDVRGVQLLVDHVALSCWKNIYVLDNSSNT